MAFLRANVIMGHTRQNHADVVNDFTDRTVVIESTSTSAKLGSTKILPVCDNDVVVVSALRTPLCKAKRGAFKDSFPAEWLSKLFTKTISSTGLNPLLIEDICVGNVLQPRALYDVKYAQVCSGIPNDVPATTVNRNCASGLQACMNIADAIKNGCIEIGLGVGFESMSRDPDIVNGAIYAPKHMLDEFPGSELLFTPVGITSENVAEQFHIPRQKQDWFAYHSHMKAENARKNGWFDDEIVSITTRRKDKDGKEEIIEIKQDEGIRPSTTPEQLARLPPAFKSSGSTTAGNASQISDGAGVVLLARRSAARRHRLPILGVVRSYAVKGCPPEIMGIGPSVAIPAALDKIGLTVDDIDIFEINEAFASQIIYCVDKLGIQYEKVNPKGGAIALGHPLGCTGARAFATLLHELKRRRRRGYGVISMCMGSGMGAAAVLEYTGEGH